ncbi:formylmethanofuran dehydrogenase subunit E [Desulfovibrionales bacterium]
MQVGSLSFDAYRAQVKSCYGYAAPGLLIGGFMVELAKQQLHQCTPYEAISETKFCLPDAIQLLTPCTINNGWLRVLDLGRYALALYDKHIGEGVRVFLDVHRLDAWPAILGWLFDQTENRKQDQEALIDEIKQAGEAIYTWQPIHIHLPKLKKKCKASIVLCPLCGEAYPIHDGGICRGCQGEAPYEATGNICRPRAVEAADLYKSLMPIPISKAIGQTLAHDLTEVTPSQRKEPAFRRGQHISASDLCRLQHMGKRCVYVEKVTAAIGPHWVHENEAAWAFAKHLAGPNIELSGPPREGKINLMAGQAGLFLSDAARLTAFNLIPGVTCASRHGYTVVEIGMQLAGTRAIPLFLPRTDFLHALALLEEGPIFSVAPLRQAKVGILVTGSEVFQGLVQDRFIPIITAKVTYFNCTVMGATIVPDDRTTIATAAHKLLAAGADLLITTAGLSVDPDDVTRSALIDAGLYDIRYGVPLLPGAMTLLGRIGNAQILGIPACALVFKTTSLDLLLPRLLAGQDPGYADLAAMGYGGMCLECNTCTYPKCSFGR